MPDTSIIVRPKLSYWLHYVWLMPMAGVVFSAVVIYGAICQPLGIHLTRPAMTGTWMTVTLGMTILALHRDRWKIYFELTDTELRIGRGARATIIPLAEIESAVYGLPAYTPWWCRFFHNQGTRRFVSATRACSLYLRYGEGGYVPLCLCYSFLRNGPELMNELIERLRGKLVGHESYTPAEVKALHLPRINRPMVMRC